MFDHFNYLNCYVLMQCYPTDMVLFTYQFYLFNILKIFEFSPSMLMAKDVIWMWMTQWGWKFDPDRQRVGGHECWQSKDDVLGEMGGWLWWLQVGGKCTRESGPGAGANEGAKVRNGEVNAGEGWGILNYFIT